MRRGGICVLLFRPYEERRLPLTCSWACAAGDCLHGDNVAPRWTMTLTGTNAQGKTVQAVIQLHLPANPAPYRKP